MNYTYRILYTFITLILFSLSVNSQVTEVWTARHNGLLDSIDIANAITTDNLGNTYVTGYSYVLLNLLTDVVTIKYDSNGNESWRTSYDHFLLFDQGTEIVMDNTNQFVYVGGFVTNLLTLADYIIIKYDASNGNIIWTQTYSSGLLADDRVTAITVDNQNKPIVTGYSYRGLFNGGYDYATVKFDDATGNPLWAATYNGTGNNEDKAYAIVVDNSDNVIVTGSTRRTGGNGSEDYGTIKYNSAGAQQWVSFYNGTGNNEDVAYAITVDNFNNPIVTGSSLSTSSAGSEDYATIKYTPAGNQSWASRYNGPGNNEDKAYAIVVDNSDNIIVTGSSRSSNSQGSEDYATVKYTPAGSQSWVSRYNGTGNGEDKAYAIVVDNSDNVYITGSSDAPNNSEDYATLRYNPNGSQHWVMRYNGPGNNEDKAYAIVVDNSDNVYVTGSSRHGTLLGTEDYLTIKYSQSVMGIHTISSNIPESYKLFQNYPNPFNPNTNIRFNVLKTSFVTLSVYNYLGQKVSTLVNHNLSPGEYETRLEAGNISSGIYFYRMTVFETTTGNTFSEVKKMILIK